MAELVCLDCYKTYDPQQGHFCVNDCWIPGAAARNMPLQEVAYELNCYAQEAAPVSSGESHELTSVNTALLYINPYINFHQLSSNVQHSLSNQVEITERSESVAECSIDESYAVAGPSHLQLSDFKCVFCLKEFDYRSEVISHAESHIGAGGFNCYICQKVIKNYRDLERHIAGHAGVNSYECKHCGKIFILKTALEAHIVTHTNKKSFSCNVCEKEFSTKTYLKDHMLSHTSDKPYECDVCGKILSNKSSLKRRMQTHIPGRRKSRK